MNKAQQMFGMLVVLEGRSSARAEFSEFTSWFSGDFSFLGLDEPKIAEKSPSFLVSFSLLHPSTSPMKSNNTVSFPIFDG